MGEIMDSVGWCSLFLEKVGELDPAGGGSVVNEILSSAPDRTPAVRPLLVDGEELHVVIHPPFGILKPFLVSMIVDPLAREKTGLVGSFSLPHPLDDHGGAEIHQVCFSAAR